MGNTERLRAALALALLLVATGPASAGSVRLLKQDATVWARTVHLKGLADPSLGTAGSVIVNGSVLPVSIAAPGDTFYVDIPIDEGANAVVAVFDSAGTPVVSDTLTLTLGYRLRARPGGQCACFRAKCHAARGPPGESRERRADVSVERAPEQPFGRRAGLRRRQHLPGHHSCGRETGRVRLWRAGCHGRRGHGPPGRPGEGRFRQRWRDGYPYRAPSVG